VFDREVDVCQKCGGPTTMPHNLRRPSRSLAGGLPRIEERRDVLTVHLPGRSVTTLTSP